jgi:hypothetical protein
MPDTGTRRLRGVLGTAGDGLTQGNRPESVESAPTAGCRSLEPVFRNDFRTEPRLFPGTTLTTQNIFVETFHPKT